MDGDPDVRAFEQMIAEQIKTMVLIGVLLRRNEELQERCDDTSTDAEVVMLHLREMAENDADLSTLRRRALKLKDDLVEFEAKLKLKYPMSH